MLKAPFPWFGGKSRVAGIVWNRFGDIPNYVEPFFGAGAVLFGRSIPPGQSRIETVNDLDGFVANAWRSIALDPEATAAYADNPVNENDLHARHAWITEQRQDLQARLEGDPDYFDPKIAGYWLWGISCWIGRHFASGNGPWVRLDGKLVKCEQLAGQGVNRQRPHLGDAGRGVNRKHSGLLEYFGKLSDRLRHVRVCCGDWSRVLTDTPTTHLGLTGVFLDPPYSVDDRDGCYTVDSFTVAHDVREWCIANQDNPLLRIALCGYKGEHDLTGWEAVPWSTNGGYSNQSVSANRHREMLWFSPHCLRPSEQLDLFDVLLLNREDEF